MCERLRRLVRGVATLVALMLAAGAEAATLGELFPPGVASCYESSRGPKPPVGKKIDKLWLFASLEHLKQEVSQQVLGYVRSELLDEEHPEWNRAAGLSGTGSTPIRSQIIMEIIRDSAPDLTGDHAKAFKDSIKQIIENSIRTCAHASP